VRVAVPFFAVDTVLFLLLPMLFLLLQLLVPLPQRKASQGLPISIASYPPSTCVEKPLPPVSINVKSFLKREVVVLFFSLRSLLIFVPAGRFFAIAESFLFS